uniref:Uncharacterized protein n=1 Tax=Podoviridae sp. ctG4L18 TaxID=2825234 RepID=A0A8S5UPN3_9CAUD|nr:MAG TPA: hypothetical protein [Podoviridae sp. ctG4L18]
MSQLQIVVSTMLQAFRQLMQHLYILDHTHSITALIIRV